MNAIEKAEFKAVPAVPLSGSITVGPAQIAWAASPCGREVGEDFFDFATPSQGEGFRDGFAIALADGLTAPGNQGREAAEICVRTVLTDYIAAPDAWTPAQTLERSARTINAWLFSGNVRRPASGSRLCTLTVLAFRDGKAHFGHVGDTRLYRIRAGMRERLTTDHVWPRSDMQHVLRRAIGLDRHIVLDCGTEDAIPGDVFMLLSDGVWEVIGETGVNYALESTQDIGAVADDLVARSLQLQKRYLGRNDATAILVKILG
jgi:serine/threonine protein phosphatase PrpC